MTEREIAGVSGKSLVEIHYAIIYLGAKRNKKEGRKSDTVKLVENKTKLKITAVLLENTDECDSELSRKLSELIGVRVYPQAVSRWRKKYL